MAIKNLRCIREDDGVAVIWAWDMDQKYAVITVARVAAQEKDHLPEKRGLWGTEAREDRHLASAGISLRGPGSQ